MSSRPTAVACATAACIALFLPTAGAATSCADLASLPLRDATITAAHEVPAGPYTPPGAVNPIGGGNLPAFCRVALTVAPQIKIEVWLPKSNWNERYQGVGGGGYAGSISYSALATALRAGYATASTDTGHPSSAGGTFALNPDGTLNRGLIEDFASRSLHEMVLKAKALINAHYGAAPKYSYWTGCSTGGRQGLMAVQRFPREYDGLVIAAPAINWERFIAAELWPQIVMQQRLGAPISTAKLNAVTSKAVAACDADDGVTDGVINDPRKCSYDPAAAICQTGDDPATCLTRQEAQAVRSIWDGPTNGKGKRVWFGLEPGTSLLGLAGTNPFSIAVQHYQYWVQQDPSADWRAVTESAFEKYFRDSHRKFNAVIGTDDDNLQRFRKQGGKVVMWHGEADQLIFPRGTVNYFERVLKGNGGAKHVDGFMRLFMAPGVAHCAGGAGPNPVGLLEAVVDWVENGVAPKRILATRTLPGGTVRSRPLCAYPQTAMWTGTGSTDDAANFACVDGRHDKKDFRLGGAGAKHDDDDDDDDDD